METALKAILASAGASDDLVAYAYVEARAILSVEVYAELGEDLKEFDQAMVEPLAALFKMPDGKVFEVTATDMPVVRARLRHAWKKAREKLATNAAPTAAASGSASATTSTTKAKELPPGVWQAQVRKYEAVTIHGVPRKFPELTDVVGSGSYPSQAAERFEE